MKTKNKK